jgi:hypothetical protein
MSFRMENICYITSLFPTQGGFTFYKGDIHWASIAQLEHPEIQTQEQLYYLCLSVLIIVQRDEIQTLILGSLFLMFLMSKGKCESNGTTDLLPPDFPPFPPIHCPPSTLFCGFDNCCQKLTEVCGDIDNALCYPKSKPFGVGGICCPSNNYNNCGGNCCRGTCSGGVCCPLGQLPSHGICCPVGQVCCPPGQHPISGICCAAGQILCAGECCSGKCVIGPWFKRDVQDVFVPAQARKREPMCKDPPCVPPKGWQCEA